MTIYLLIEYLLLKWASKFKDERRGLFMYHIIINPASRSGKGLKIWKEQVEPLLHRDGIPYRSYFSGHAGDVAQIVREICASQGAEPSSSQKKASKERRITLIVLGGDGTINEALQGLDDNTQLTLGYIPTGSSNDFARDLGIPKEPAAALDIILHNGRTRSMDLGTITYDNGQKRRFVVSTGIGYDAAVCEEALHSKIKAFCNKIGLGKLTYLGIALKQLFTTKAVSCTLTLDDKPPIEMKRMLFIASMLHRYEGGGFMFCPDADPDDGLLNICAVGDLPRLLILFALPTAFFGKHYIFKGIDAYTANRIKIETSAPLWVHTDGEVGQQTTSYTIECNPAAVNIIVP